MKKVLVIGCPGSGKSYFSRRLRELTKLPLCHLDMLFRNGDRTTVSREVFLERPGRVLEIDVTQIIFTSRAQADAYLLYMAKQK